MRWALPREGGVETLAGFILARLGHIPQPGETVEYEMRRLTVLEMTGRRISKVRVENLESSAAGQGIDTTEEEQGSRESESGTDPDQDPDQGPSQAGHAEEPGQ